MLKLCVHSICLLLYCSTVHDVPNRVGGTMLCLSNSSLSNTSRRDFAHHHSTAVKNQSTFFQGENDMHDDDISTSNDVDNDSNCLCDTSDSNESSSFLKDNTSTHEIGRASCRERVYLEV